MSIAVLSLHAYRCLRFILATNIGMDCLVQISSSTRININFEKSYCCRFIKKKKTLCPLFIDRFNYLQVTERFQGEFTFTIKSPEFLVYQRMKYRLSIFFLFISIAVLSFVFVHFILLYLYAKLPVERGSEC